MGQGALMELQQQIQQPNLQTQLMEQMSDRVCLLEPQVRKEKTQQEQQQSQQRVMGQWTNGDHLLEKLVQQDETIVQKQQQSQIPMGQVALLDFFELPSQRLPPSLEQTTVDDYEDDESRSIQSKEEESNQMQ